MFAFDVIFYCLSMRKEICAVHLSVCHWALMSAVYLFGPLELLQDTGH